MLVRQAVQSGGVYLCYNSLGSYIFVGREAPQWFIQQLFKVNSFREINKTMSEEEIFADADSSHYLTALYSLLNQVRYQRQPFVELRVLLEGDQESENILSSMLISDNRHPVYGQDFQRFLNTVSGSMGSGPHSYY